MATQQTQSSWFMPTAQQTELMDLAMPGIRKFASSGGIQPYTGNTVAGFDPAQTQGQETALGAVGAQNNILSGAQNTYGNWTGDNVWSPEFNTMMSNAQEAAVRPITDQFLQSTLPALRSDSIMTGGYGGSRLQRGEDIATRNAMRQVGDTSAGIVKDLYSTNVNAQMNALNQTPQMLQSTLMPAQTQSAVGDARQAMEQARLNAAQQQHYLTQLAPLMTSQEIAQLLGAFPGGTTMSTASNPDQPDKWKTALGGAATGATLGSAFGPIGTAIGGLGGGLLGLFG